ncbi:MAG: rhodanese-like domain-containing protein [Pseudomonadota bacterium]
MLSITNISAYQFIHLSTDFLLELQIILKKECQQLSIKGTILLSTEGINLFLAGRRKAITEFQALLNSFYYFKNLVYKESLSDFQPFKKMLVKIKKEIISFGIDTIQPETFTAPSISPETLKKWLLVRPNLVLLDVRNTFEVELGSFENSLHLDLQHFRDFPKSVQKLYKTIKNLPIITFCTGGIRCEKASAFLLQTGFNEVYQLEGGILNYFKKCGGDNYKGLCFVFDERKALMSSLEVTNNI